MDFGRSDGSAEGVREGVSEGKKVGISDGNNEGRVEGIKEGGNEGVVVGRSEGWAEGSSVGGDEGSGGMVGAGSSSMVKFPRSCMFTAAGTVAAGFRSDNVKRHVIAMPKIKRIVNI